MTIQAAQTTASTFAVGDLVRVDGDQPTEAPWRITAIVTDDPQHDGPYALLESDFNGSRSWSALRILVPYHPSWCAADIPSHISAERTVVATSGPERAEIYVSLEQAAGEPVAVRVQGAGDTPMTPAQALQLAAVLTASAFAAVAR